jgi:hypothetical protein
MGLPTVFVHPEILRALLNQTRLLFTSKSFARFSPGCADRQTRYATEELQYNILTKTRGCKSAGFWFDDLLGLARECDG